MNRRDHRRITLISRAAATPRRPWLIGRDAPHRLIFVGSFGVIPYALARGVEDLGEDIDSVIIDGTATASEYLNLLSTLPPTYAGDVVLIETDSAFVSATGRGGDRVLYALRPEDVRFYLETKMLIGASEQVAA
jgi:hypothetical protein